MKKGHDYIMSWLARNGFDPRDKDWDTAWAEQRRTQKAKREENYRQLAREIIENSKARKKALDQAIASGKVILISDWQKPRKPRRP